MRNTRRTHTLLSFGVLALATALSAPARAQEDEGDLATKWKVNDENPRASIPSEEERNSDPMAFAYFLQDLAARGERSAKRKNWPDLVKYYEAMARAVPDAGVSFRRLCLGYQMLGKHEIAAGYCGKALGMRAATVWEHLRFIESSLLIEKLSAKQLDDVEASLKHLRDYVKTHPQQDPLAGGTPEEPRKPTREELLAEMKAKQALGWLDRQNDEKPAPTGPAMHLPTEIELLNAKIAVRLNDGMRLGASIDELRRLKVNETQLIALLWTHALLTNDKADAKALLEKARSLGVPEATIASMAAQNDARFPNPVGKFLPVALLVVVLASGGYLFVRVRQRKASGAGRLAA